MTKMRSVCKQTINGQESPNLTVSSKCEINNSPVVSKHNEFMMPYSLHSSMSHHANRSIFNDVLISNH